MQSLPEPRKKKQHSYAVDSQDAFDIADPSSMQDAYVSKYIACFTTEFFVSRSYWNKKTFFIPQPSAKFIIFLIQ